jgi:uncharacterized protein (TIGR00730 family)
MKSICVFCGSSPGVIPVYAQAAFAMGAEIARRGMGLVYGGGSVGLMGIVADGALSEGGEVHGVIPAALKAKELGHDRLTRLDVVETMHERKARMAELSDGFIAMPGGIGTFEEIFEVWTWAQLGIHAKPLGFLNVAGFYDALAAFLDATTSAGFLRAHHRAMALSHSEPGPLLDALAAFEPVQAVKWLDLKQS